MNKTIKKSLLLSVLLICICLTSCNKNLKFYSKTFYNFFDTVSVISVYTENAQKAEEYFTIAENMLREYHRLFDIYNSYENLNNLKTINENRGIAPCVVDKEIMELLKLGVEAESLTKGNFNIAFGGVLDIWHNYRETYKNNPSEAVLPDLETLKEAARHCDIKSVILDEAKSTVFIEDSQTLIDCGGLAKGYAAEKIGEKLKAQGLSSGSINLGGNISVIGRLPRGEKWTAAIENPINRGELCKVAVSDQSVITSGGGRRYYEVDGKKYHHIIHPDTLMPADKYLQVTVICENTYLGDAISTALFNMDLEEGEALCKSLGFEALWLLNDGSVKTTEGAATTPPQFVFICANKVLEGKTGVKGALLPCGFLG